MFTLKSIWHNDVYLGMGEIVPTESEYISTGWNSNHDGYGTKIEIAPIENTLWGDYAGSVESRSNYEYIMSTYKDLLDANIIKRAGGHYNASQLYILASLENGWNLSADDIEQILAENDLDNSLASEVSWLLYDLDNNGVICEESLQELEAELLEEAFENYLTWDIMRVIENWYYYNEELNALELDILDIIDCDYDPENEDGQNELAKHIINTYYDDYDMVWEDANGPYLDIDRLLAKDHVKIGIKKIVDKLIKKAVKESIKTFWVD